MTLRHHLSCLELTLATSFFHMCSWFCRLQVLEGIRCVEHDDGHAKHLDVLQILKWLEEVVSETNTIQT